MNTKQRIPKLKKEVLPAEPPRQAIPPARPNPEQGLSADEVELRLAAGWSNDPGEPPTKKESQIIKEHSLTFFNLIFVVLAVCLVLVGSIKNLMFLVIAIANTAIG